jgi:hypothetical protein
MSMRMWFVAALSATAFVLALRQDLRGPRRPPSSPPYERITVEDRRAIEARDRAADRREVERAYDEFLDSLYAHRRANPGRAFDGLELGSFPSDDVLELANIHVRPQLDDHGQLVGLFVNALRDSWPTVCHDDECGTPTCTLERRLVAAWGEPDERVGANDFATWIDPALRLRATFAWPCILRFERY